MSCRTYCIKDLAVIAGSNGKENVRRVISHVLHHAEALEYDWAGKGSWKGQIEEAKRASGSLLISLPSCDTVSLKILITIYIKYIYNTMFDPKVSRH